MATGRWARGLHRNTDACPPGPRRCKANNCCADPRYDTARTAVKCMKLHVSTSDGPGQSKHQPQQGRRRRILGALYDGCPRVARLIMYANQRRAPAGGTVPQINLIEVAPTRPTRYLGLAQDSGAAWAKVPNADQNRARQSCSPSAARAGRAQRPGRNQFAKQRNSTLRRLVAGLGSFGPAGISPNVAAGCAVDQWQDLILDRLNPAGRLRPLGPVPLDQIDAVVTIVIGAT
jgi:hypothetical protein